MNIDLAIMLPPDLYAVILGHVECHLRARLKDEAALKSWLKNSKHVRLPAEFTRLCNEATYLLDKQFEKEIDDKIKYAPYRSTHTA